MAKVKVIATSERVKKIKEEIKVLEKACLKKMSSAKLSKVGLLYFQIGQLNNAMGVLERAMREFPAEAKNFKYYGDCLVVAQRHGESLDFYKMAIKLQPDYEEALAGLGDALMYLKRFEEAAQLYEKALAEKDTAENNNNVGVLLFQTRYYKQAAAFFQKAVELEKGDKKFAINYAKALFRDGQYNQAFTALHDALLLDREDNFVKAQLSNVARIIQIKEFSPFLKEIMLDCFGTENIDHQNFSGNLGKMFALDPTFDELVRLTKHTKYEDFAKDCNYEAIKPALFDEFLNQGIRLVSVQSPQLERLFVHLRKYLLEVLASRHDTDKESQRLLKFICALAEYFFLNEYIASITPEEISAIEALKSDAFKEQDPNRFAQIIAICGCYEALHCMEPPLLSAIMNLNLGRAPHWKSLVDLQIREPQKEREIRATISSFSGIVDEVSIKVREQYEENPYPRWRYANAQIDSDKNYLFKKPYKILIAGCGTGKQVLQDHYMYPNAHITAVDLSLSSISYAKRKVEELKIPNVNFIHADILDLGKLPEKYDFVMCSGVIHHMRDPEAGLKVLVSLLKEGGHMNLGLYSEYARRVVVQLRNLVAEKQWPANLDGIRLLREYIINLPKSDSLNYVMNWRDFYSTSMCRDLIFHVQEHRYTFLSMEDMFKRHGLEFLDFSFIFPDVLAKFKKKHPDLSDYYSFKIWDEFEQNYPDSFASMYQVWLCKKEDKDSILARPRIINVLDA